MDDLRWVLLISGVLVVLGVVLFGRRKPGSDDVERVSSSSPLPDSGEDRVEPSFSGDKPSPAPEPAIDESDEVADDSDDDGAIRSVEQKIVTVRIVANDKAPFAGDELVLSLRGIGMRHGRFGIFHRYDGNDENRVVFSAASLVEPGSFELENIKEQKIPGISLFMVLPGPIDGAEAFDQMMAASRTLTQSLGAELLDESGSSLSIQRERYLREEIIQYQLESRVG